MHFAAAAAAAEGQPAVKPADDGRVGAAGGCAWLSPEEAWAARTRLAMVAVGLGRIVVYSHHRSSTSYQIC